MITKLHNLKTALAELGNIDQEAGNLVPQTGAPDLVAVGQRLWWIIKKSNKALDVIKERLREEANGTTTRFESGEGSHCMVICPAIKAVIRKDTDIPKLKTELGERFLDIFEEVVTYKLRKDFKDSMKFCTPQELLAVLRSTDMVEDTPRITFKD